MPSQLLVYLCRVMAELAMHLINTTFAEVTARPASDKVRGDEYLLLVGTEQAPALLLVGMSACILPWGRVSLHIGTEHCLWSAMATAFVLASRPSARLGCTGLTICGRVLLCPKLSMHF